MFYVVQAFLLLVGKPFVPVLIMTVWGTLILYSIYNFKQRMVLFVFGVTFFTFLLGRTVLVDIFPLFEQDPVFSDAVNNETNILLLITLCTITISYAVFEHFDKYRINRSYRVMFKSIRPDYENVKNTYKSVSKALFYVTFPFLIITALGRVLYVFKFGYLQYYTSYKLQVPYIVKKIGDFAQIDLFVFLFCKPNKKEAKPLIFLYMFYLILSIGTGQRFEFVCGLLMLFIYFILRNRQKSEVWLSKKQLVILIILFPVFLSFLSLINDIRMNNTVTVNGLLKNFFDFYYDLGSSSNVLKYEILLGHRLSHKFYCFGTIITFFRENLISRLFGANSYSGNTIDHALNGFSYTHAISYAGWGRYYLAGNGMGSCYIAELFHAFSYGGVIVGNIIYGLLIDKLYRFKGESVLGNALIFYSLYNFLLAPRGPYDGFTNAIFNPTSLIAIGLIYFVSKYLINRSAVNKQSKSRDNYKIKEKKLWNE